MIIVDRRNSNIVIALAKFFLFFIIVVDTLQDNATNCPGPIKYYEGLGCKPIYRTKGSGCPIRYDCDDWKDLSDNECLINGNKYQRGEKLRDEDKNPCDDCTCNGSLGWSCSEVTCASRPSRFFDPDGEPRECYNKHRPDQCCPGPEICLEKGEKRPICLVDGKIYQDGELFIPSTEPEKRCYCGEGYVGENDETFCILPKHTWCDDVLIGARNIRDGYVPVYENNQSLHKDCSTNFRYQTSRDAVFKRTGPSRFTSCELENPGMMCTFGHLTMEIGDELRNVHWFHTCVRCICEVPPVPTCRLKPHAECIPCKNKKIREKYGNLTECNIHI